ncbi:hydroxymethylbilane synthase [Arenimonas sp. GDDSR-1]|uniref:hydroxymethylbilane synthase n=1 Tax=Arenimonas sp. GDDSR-1 TaxID=2950125 RepID=UPI002621C452|nr:hydroxymethylbilane synthase [Arenimonas sp. GDDSR-1]
MKILRLATRESTLALWQTNHVAALLRAAHPGLQVEPVPMTTRGDQILDVSLSKIGGKGLFLKELEVAMLEGRADAAVHSLKDVPMQLEPEFALAAVLARDNPFDAFISDQYATLAELPAGAVVGTSSQRRQVQLKQLRPDLQLRDLRGNINTRLAKCAAGEYDAIILACAGLERLGLHSRIRSQLAAPQWWPAVAQGAIAVECRSGDPETAALFAALNHRPTELRVRAERAMNRALHGSCQVPVAAYAELTDGRMRLTGWVGDAENVRSIQADADGDAADPEAIGGAVAEKLFALGAADLLRL